MRTLILSTILIFSLLAQTPGQRYAPVPFIPAVAKLCGNKQVRVHQKIMLYAQIRAEGCETVTFQYIGDGWWLGYGTRVLVGEIER